MPAFNAKPYIRQAIESVLTQDYGPFEFLVGDDRSTDGTRRLIETCCRHPKVHLYLSPTRLGSPGLRNRLIRMARGEYLSMCDADDILPPGNLRLLSSILGRLPSIGVAHGETGRIAGKRFLTTWKTWKNALADRWTPPVVWESFFPVPPHGGSMIRKDLLLRVGGYDERYAIAHDYDLMIKLSEITGVYPVRHKVLYWWRRRKGSLGSREDLWQKEAKRILHYALERRRSRMEGSHNSGRIPSGPNRTR
jgi:glycosyltransferase involved in cell wall biosynthesis